MTDPATIERLATYLGDAANARPASGFPAAAQDVEEAGLYAWWADPEGLAQLSESFGVELPALIYAGQTGATSKRSGTERLTNLRARIGGNHLGGNINSSTFRKSLAAALREPLGLQLKAPNRLDAESNQALTAWMQAHLSVATIGVPDRAALAEIEEAVLELLDPPLNLMGMARTPLRADLMRRRAALGVSTQPGDASAVTVPIRSEAGVVEAFCRHLEAEGWMVETEVDTVDIRGTKDGITLLAEAKGVTSSPGLDVDTLYGQLLRCMDRVPGTVRYVLVVPEAVTPMVERVEQSVRQRLGVEVTSVDEAGAVRWH